MGTMLKQDELREYAATNRRLAKLASEQGNLALARELAAIAQEADTQLAAKAS